MRHEASRRVPRRHRAISNASRTMSARMCDATRHPTSILEKASVRKHTYATPAHVATKVRSTTHNWLGAVAVKSL